MNTLNDMHQFMFNELELKLNQALSSTVQNWFTLLQTKSPADYIDTTVPKTVLMTLASSGFKLTHASVEYYPGDYYVAPFDHQQLSGFLPFAPPESALRMVLINRHTGTLHILADSAWPIVSLCLYNEFTTWTALVNVLVEKAGEPTIKASSLAIDLTPGERMEIDSVHDPIAKLRYLTNHIGNAIHLYAVIMTFYPGASPGTPFFQTKLEAITHAVRNSQHFDIADYNPNVITNTNIDTASSAA